MECNSEDRRVFIYINIIVGDVTGSSVAQGGRNNRADCLPHDFVPKLLDSVDKMIRDNAE